MSDKLDKTALLKTWGYLDALQMIYRDKGKAAADRGDTTGEKLTADYSKDIAELEELKATIDAAAEAQESKPDIWKNCPTMKQVEKEAESGQTARVHIIQPEPRPPVQYKLVVKESENMKKYRAEIANSTPRRD